MPASFQLTASLTALAMALAGCAAPAMNTQVQVEPTDFIRCGLQADADDVYKGSCEVTCSVNALAVNFDGLEAKRACSGPLRTVQAELVKTETAGKWLGKMQGVKPEDPTRFEVVSNDVGNVGRTPFGWFKIMDMKETDGKLAIRMNADRQVPPSKYDIAIIARAIDLLPSEAVWNKEDNRQCPAGQPKLSLFCALTQATTEISGGVHYRQPAMQAVREELNKVDPARIKTHRIMDYNNHPATTLTEVHALLRAAKTSLERDMAAR